MKRYESFIELQDKIAKVGLEDFVLRYARSEDMPDIESACLFDGAEKALTALLAKIDRGAEAEFAKADAEFHDDGA